MKHLLLLFFFSGSLDGFSQVNPDSLIKKCNDLIARCNKMVAEMNEFESKYLHDIGDVAKPDTLRALMLISLSHKFHGVAHARMGYVVVQPGKPVIYLDCFKRQYKKPAKGWGYELIDKPKEK